MVGMEVTCSRLKLRVRPGGSFSNSAARSQHGQHPGLDAASAGAARLVPTQSTRGSSSNWRGKVCRKAHEYIAQRLEGQDTAAMTLPETRTPVRCVVLDTNAVLDWLVFRNPAMHPWGQAILERRIAWLGCARMRDEFAHMAAHASLARWKPDVPRALATLDTCCSQILVPAATPAVPQLRCTDTDDQVFIDLALAHGARWLLTHDRALLKLARRAAPLGLTIQRPADAGP